MLQYPPTACSATVAPLCARYVAMLEDAGIPSPLQQELTVAAVLVDLCEVAGARPPEPVLASLAAPSARLLDLLSFVWRWLSQIASCEEKE